MFPVLLILTLSAVCLASGLLLWHALRRRRSTKHARSQRRRWAQFAAVAPEPEPDADGPAFALVGGTGEVVVRQNGICLRLAADPGRTVWVPWHLVRRFERAPKGGAVLWLDTGLELRLDPDGCRAVWAAQSASRRPSDGWATGETPGVALA